MTLRTQSGKVWTSGTTLLAQTPSLTAAGLAAPLQAACLTGATSLLVNGQNVALGRYAFTGIGPGAGTATCTVTATSAGNLRVSIVGVGGWTTVNGEYPVDDPENLEDAEQRRNGLRLSIDVYRAALGVLSEGRAATEVAAALQPLCLLGFERVTVGGRAFPYASMPAPIGIASCTVEPLGEFDFVVTVTTQSGWRYVNGQRPFNDPDNLNDENQAYNGARRSGQVNSVALAIRGDAPSLPLASIAAALRPICLQEFTSVTVQGNSFPYGLWRAPIGLTACTVVVDGTGFKVTVTTENGSRYVNGAPEGSGGSF